MHTPIPAVDPAFYESSGAASGGLSGETLPLRRAAKTLGLSVRTLCILAARGEVELGEQHGLPCLPRREFRRLDAMRRAAMTASCT